jgi:hypothetical protein
MSGDDVLQMMESINRVAAQGLRSGLDAGKAERDEILSALRLVTEELETLAHDEKCDHSVGICWCGVAYALGRARIVLIKYNAEKALREIEG